jgi:hypothetical protein
LSLEFAPAVNEAMAVNESLEAGRIQCAGFDELKQAGLVLGASSLEGNGREVFRREHVGGNSFHVVLNRVSQRFFQERIAGGQELNGPSRDPGGGVLADVLSDFHLA